MLRSIDFKTMPYLFTDKAGTCLTVEFDGRELEGIYKQVKAMYDQENPADTSQTAREEPMMNDVKDKTLHEVIDWCENQRRKILADIEPAPGEDVEETYADLESVIRSDNPIIKYSNDLLDGSEAFVYGVIMSARLLDHIIDHCRSMLGYSGTMLTEVPNQSEDAKE